MLKFDWTILSKGSYKCFRESVLIGYRDSTQSSNGEMLKRNDDGSQDIEIFRPGPGESFGFFVYKEESDSDTGGDPLQSNPIITEAASMDQLLQLKLHQIENSASQCILSINERSGRSNLSFY